MYKALNLRGIAVNQTLPIPVPSRVDARDALLDVLVSLKDNDDVASLENYFRHFSGDHLPTKVTLLHVIQPISRHNDVRCSGQDANRNMEACASGIVNAGAWLLQNRKIEFDLLIREGDAASEILDAAEMLGCSAIAMFERRLNFLPKLLSHGVVRKVARSKGAMPVVTISRNGMIKVRQN